MTSGLAGGGGGGVTTGGGVGTSVGRCGVVGTEVAGGSVDVGGFDVSGGREVVVGGVVVGGVVGQVGPSDQPHGSGNLGSGGKGMVGPSVSSGTGASREPLSG